MGEMITFKRPDGKEAPGYEAKPGGVDAAPGIVVIQEWWGINEQIRKVGDRFVQEGYRVVIPDLFRGKVTLDEAEAAHLMRSLDFGAAAAQDVRGAVMHLKAEGSRKAGITGFCMGGALTVLAAVHAVEGDAAVSFYGYPPPEAADTTTIGMPLLGHFANDDEFFPIAGVDDLEQRLKNGKVDHQFYRYDARHAFCNEERPNYDPAAARIAWHRTVEFFNKHLKK
jgi:carboxymethylenebutenolidase